MNDDYSDEEEEYEDEALVLLGGKHYLLPLNTLSAQDVDALVCLSLKKDADSGGGPFVYADGINRLKRLIEGRETDRFVLSRYGLCIRQVYIVDDVPEPTPPPKKKRKPRSVKPRAPKARS